MAGNEEAHMLAKEAKELPKENQNHPDARNIMAQYLTNQPDLDVCQGDGERN